MEGEIKNLGNHNSNYSYTEKKLHYGTYGENKHIPTFVMLLTALI
jgi:hypothetical protein